MPIYFCSRSVLQYVFINVHFCSHRCCLYPILNICIWLEDVRKPWNLSLLCCLLFLCFPSLRDSENKKGKLRLGVDLQTHTWAHTVMFWVLSGFGLCSSCLLLLVISIFFWFSVIVLHSHSPVTSCPSLSLSHVLVTSRSDAVSVNLPSLLVFWFLAATSFT